MFGISTWNVGTRLMKHLAVLVCVVVAGCEVQPPFGAPVPPDVDGSDIRPDAVIEAFMSAERSVVVRDDSSEGGSEVTVESSTCATYTWLFEVIERNDSGDIISRTPLAQLGRTFLDIETPSPTQITAISIARILQVLSDPGPNGTEIMATVTITSTSSEGEACEPAEVDGEVITRQITLLVTRPSGPLTVTLSSAAGTRVSPGESLELSAVISGGTPILDPPIPCTGFRVGNRPNNSGTPYVVEWNLTATDPVLDPDAVGGTAVFEADCLELGDGVVETQGRYTAPNETGNVLASIVAVDARGNRTTASLSIVVGAPEPLTFAEASIDATRIAPGTSTGIQVRPEGGTPPYDVVIELTANAADRIGNLQVGGSTASSSVGCNSLAADVPCEATYSALANRTGNDLVRITATDAVGDSISTTIPLTVASAQTLSLSAIATPPIVFSEGGTGTITASIAGGTPPYQVCYAIEPDSVGGLTLSDGAGCPGIGTLTNCTCNLARPDDNSPAIATRILTAGGMEGFATIRVQAEDAVGDASTQFVSVDVSVFSSAGQVETTDLTFDGTMVAETESICLAIGDGADTPVNPINVDMNFTGGVGPFAYAWSDSTGGPTRFTDDESKATTWTPDALDPASDEQTIQFTGTVTDTRTNLSSPLTVDAHLHAAALAQCDNPADELVPANVTEVCEGEDIVLLGGPDGQASYVWRDPANAEIPENLLDVTNRLISPAVAGVYTLEITSTVPDAMLCTDTDTTEVIVNEVPTAEPGMDLLGADAICGNEPITVGAPAPAIGGIPPYSCLWTGDGAPFLSATNVCDPTFDPPDEDFATITYSLNLQVTDNSSTMCGSDFETIMIEVLPVPTANAGADADVCADDPTPLGGLPAATGGSGGYTFAWTGTPDCVGFLDDPTLGNPTIDPPDDTDLVCEFTLSVTDSDGCTDTDDVTITINSTPVPDPGMDMVGPNAVCAAPGMPIGGTPAATGGTPPFTFLWTGSCAGYLDDVNAENPFFDPPDDTMETCFLFLTVTDDNNCDATAGPIAIDILSSPTADAGDAETVCSGDATVLGGVDAVSGGTPPYTITWSSNPPACVAFLDSTAVENPGFDTNGSPFTGTCVFTLDVEDSTGCGDQDTVTIDVVENPTADAGTDLTGGNGICDNEDAQIGGEPTADGGTAPYTFVWSGTCVDDGFLTMTDVANPTISAPDNTTSMCDATVTVTDDNTCVDTDTISIDIFPSSAVDAGPDFTGGDALCAGDMQVIGGSPTVTGGSAPTVVQWAGAGIFNLDDGALENPTFTAPANDSAGTDSFDFIVQVTSDANGCASRNQDMMTIDVLATTNITAQPPMMIVGDTGMSVDISLSAAGANLSFQWQFASDGETFVDLVDGGRISGATTDTLTIDPVNNNDVGAYRCIVDGTCDGGAITSDETSLMIMCPVDPATVTTPETCVCFAPGADDQTISVIGGGETPTFEWQKEVAGMPGTFVSVLEFNGADMPLQAIDEASASTDTLLFTQADTIEHPGNYRCVVSNQCGSVTSEIIAVNVQTPCTGVCP